VRGHLGATWVALTALAATALYAAGAGAQVLPLGGKTAQMGGAATANGRDSAMPYLNPAGLAGLPKDLFALSANIYGASRFRIEPFFIKEFTYPSTVEEDVQSSRSTFQLPSSVMYLTSASDESAHVRHKVGVSLTIPTATKITVQGRYRAVQPTAFGADNDSRFYAFEYTDYNLGATYALAVGSRLRLGATLFGRYTTSQTSVQTIRNYYAFNGVLQSDWAASSTSTESTSSTWAKVGGQAELWPGLWAGAAVSTPTFLHQGSGKGAGTLASQALGVAVNEKQTTEWDARDRLPLAANFGLSYERPEAFGLALDVTHTRGLERAGEARGTVRSNATVTGEIIRDFTRSFASSTAVVPVTNVAIGGEVWVRQWLAVRLGGFTSFSNVDDPDPAVAGPYSGAGDTFGLTGGLGLLFGPTETSLGVSFQRTTGKIAVEDGSFSAQTPVALADFSINTVLFMLAGAVSVGEAREQIERALPKGAPRTPLPAGFGAPATSLPAGISVPASTTPAGASVPASAAPGASVPASTAPTTPTPATAPTPPAGQRGPLP
jgi:hypothetical protein